MPRSKVAGLRAFRRVRMDRILGLVGVVFVLIGTALAFTWPPPPPPIDFKYDVDWPLTSHTRPVAAGTLAEGASRVHNFEIDVVNATSVQFWFEFKDDIGDEPWEQDSFLIRVEGPTGSNVSFTFDVHAGRVGANVSRTLGLSGIPDITRANGTTESEAWAHLGDRTNRTGFGSWKFTVLMNQSVGDYRNPPTRDPNFPCAEPACTPDPGNAYRLGFSFQTYRATLRKGF